MTDALLPLSLPLDTLAAKAQAPAPSAEELAKRGQIAKTAQDFEASFLAIMLNTMLKGVEQQAPFSGGEGEEMFKSFMGEAMAKQMTKAGGIGLSGTVQREMLKLQGLEQ